MTAIANTTAHSEKGPVTSDFFLIPWTFPGRARHVDLNFDSPARSSRWATYDLLQQITARRLPA